METPVDKQGGPPAAIPAPLQDLHAERSLVPAGYCHQRTLSALSQQQLSRDIERDVLQGLPLELRPSGIHSSSPRLWVERVHGDKKAIDVTVVHTFRAHFEDELPSPPGPGSPPAAGLAAAAAAAMAAEAQRQAHRLAATSSGLRVEELPHSGSDGLETDSGHPGSGTCAPASEAGALPRLACRVEMPDSPRGASSAGGDSRSGSTASMATPSAAGEPSARLPSAPEPSSNGPESEPSPKAGAAVAAVAGLPPQQLRHDVPITPPPAQQHAQHAQQAQQTQQAADHGMPAEPPAAWEPAEAAAAEVRRRFSQDPAWEGLQRQRLALSRQDSLLPYEINPRDLVVGERLAVGGFAEVFVGRYQGTAVAIKLLLSVDEQGQESFRAEAHVLERLRHPNIVLFMGVCTRPYLAIVSEYMARGSLFRLLHRGGSRPLPPKLQRSVAVSVARGMAYLHSRSPPLLHLDLKSPNILLDDRWRVKIADFGLSRLKSTASRMQGTGSGTPEWAAPEMLRSEAYDERADVYSYGVVLWECLTGQQPWQGLHPMQVVGTVGFQGGQLPTADLQGDPCLVSLCRRCMAAEPGLRPTFRDILQELEASHTPASWSNSQGSQALGEAVPADGPTDEAANGALTERQPAAAVAQRWARSAGSAVPDGVAGAVAAKDAAAGHEGPYGGHEGSLLGPSAPLPVSPPSAPSLQAASHGPEAADAVASSHTGPPPLAAARQQQQQQLQPSPFAAAADAVDLAAAAAPAGHCLHPVHSITDDSPFARMPPLGSGSDEDEDSGGTLRGLRSKPSRLGAISEGRHSGSGSSSSNSGPASSALQQGDAVELAADFSQLLSIQRSTSGEAVLDASRLSSCSLGREPEPSSLTLLHAADSPPPASGSAGPTKRLPGCELGCKTRPGAASKAASEWPAVQALAALVPVPAAQTEG